MSGASRRQYKTVLLCALHAWGGADMINLFDPEGRKLADPERARRPIAPRAQRAAQMHGANHVIPFSGFHFYQRQDSAWANAFIPELDDYQTDARPDGPRMLPAFVRVNAENGEIRPHQSAAESAAYQERRRSSATTGPIR